MMLIFAVVPMGPMVSIFGTETPLQLTDFPVSVLYVLAIARREKHRAPVDQD